MRLLGHVFLVSGGVAIQLGGDAVLGRVARSNRPGKLGFAVERGRIQGAARIHRLAIVGCAVRADAVEVLQTEPERIDVAVAARALCPAGGCGGSLPQRTRTGHVGLDPVHRGCSRRRAELMAEHALVHEDPALDDRTLGRPGVNREEPRRSEKTDPGRVARQGHRAERRSGHPGHPVKSGELLVHECGSCRVDVHVVRVLLGHRRELLLDLRAHGVGKCGGEPGKGDRIFFDADQAIGFQKIGTEGDNPAPGSWIGKQTIGFVANALRSGQRSRVGSGHERVVRNRVPEQKRHASRHLVTGILDSARDVRIGSRRR